MSDFGPDEWAERERLDHIAQQQGEDQIAKERELQARLAELEAEVARLRAGESEEPAGLGVEMTPAEFIHKWNAATAERRLGFAQTVLERLYADSDCFIMGHQGRLEDAEGYIAWLRKRLLRMETAWWSARIGRARDRAAGQAWKDNCLVIGGERDQLKAGLAQFREFLDGNFRFWCSPHAIAAQYATALIEELDRRVALDQPKEGDHV